MREKVAFVKIQLLCCSDATRLIPTEEKLSVGGQLLQKYDSVCVAFQ